MGHFFPTLGSGYIIKILMPLSQTFEYKMSFILRGKEKIFKKNQKPGFY